MKRITKLFISGTLLASMSGAVMAQDLSDFLGAGLSDGNKVATAFFQPYGEMLGVNLNSGWYNSASVHKLGGFDLTFEASAAFSPSSMKTFDAGSLGLENFTASAGTSPTLAGSGSSQTLTPKGLNGYGSFKLPDGSGNGILPSAMIQAAVGLPFHTEIMGRYMPKLDLGSYGNLGLWGIGVKHSLKSYIPFVNRVPIWNLSVMAAYTHFNSTMDVDYNGNKGSFEIGSNAYTLRVLTGINLPMVAFYTGLGYGNTSSSFDLKGTYSGIPNASMTPQTVTDPFSLKYKDGNFDCNVGARLRLGIIAFHADYTVGKYNTVTAGVGISFR